MNRYKNIRAFLMYVLVCGLCMTPISMMVAAEIQEDVPSQSASEGAFVSQENNQDESVSREVEQEDAQQMPEQAVTESADQVPVEQQQQAQPSEQLSAQDDEQESAMSSVPTQENQKNGQRAVVQEHKKSKEQDVESAIKKIDKPVAQKSKASQKKDSISIHYEDEDLVNIINFFAAKQGVNIMLPQGGNAIKAKVTFKLENEVSVERAWHELLPMILDVAGYAIEPQEDIYVIVKTSKDIVREPMPVYIGVASKDLPATDQRIRYLYYLSNIKLTESSESEFTTILKELMPEDVLYKTDALANALLIVAKSSDIRSIMHIIEQLDQVTFQEKMEIVPLRHTAARVVADMFNEKILRPASEMNRYRLDARKKSEANYFSPFVKLIAEERTNSLIILGRQQAVDRVLEFIQEYIDVELETGQSILHVYKLQYLDAKEFAPTLQRIVESTRSGGTGQSKGSKGSGGSTERFFDEVVIIADRPTDAEALNYYGGNKLVIAARNDDWHEIKQLIEDLDTPQPQVIIEVLIADLTIEDQRALGNILRNPAKIPLPADIAFQSASYAGTVVQQLGGAQTIQADLLSGNALTSPPPPHSIPSTLLPGNAVLSLSDNDGSTWSLLRIAKSFTHTKILSHPYVIATNNQWAEVIVGETRLLRDEAGGTSGGAAVQKFKPISANLRINIRPRISMYGEREEHNGIVNMQVEVDISEFLPGSASNNARNSRVVHTNANVADGNILALGGLIRSTDSDGLSATPFLSQIPILGWLFKTRTANLGETNLTVFISPTIIEPRLRHGVSEYTQDYISLTKDYVKEGVLFDALRDPVTRWMFKTSSKIVDSIDDFVARDEFKVNVQERKKTKREIQVVQQKKDKHNNTINIAHNEPVKKSRNASVHERKKSGTQTTQVAQRVTEQYMSSAPGARASSQQKEQSPTTGFKQRLQQDENPFKSAGNAKSVGQKAAHLQS
jgi:general secretion pathway protein D